MTKANSKKRKPDPNIVTQVIENPYGIKPDLRIVRGEHRYDPPQQAVVRSVRDDPLARLHCRGQIGEAEYEAGRLLQKYFEASEVGRIDSSGDIQERVDGGVGVRDPFTEAQQRALKQLSAISPVLGKEGYAVIRFFLAERLFANQIARHFGKRGTRADVEYYNRRIKECLSSAATHLKFA